MFLDCRDFTQRDIAKALVEDENIESKLRALCQGLDAQSIAQINTILVRLRKAYFLKKKKCFDLTKEEIEEFEKIKTEFFPNIVKVGNAYFYQGYFLPKNAFEVSVMWHKHSLDKIENWEHIRKKSIIDVGGFVGDSALVLQEYTDDKIYCFEAMQENYNTILETIALNRTTKIIPVKKALGAQKGVANITINGSASSMQFTANECESEAVEIITLDEFVAQNNIQVGFIKVDIEGFEMEFLKGALQTIKTQKPAMLLSIYHQASDFFGIKPFIESLDLGYKFKVHKPIDCSVSVETALFCEVR